MSQSQGVARVRATDITTDRRELVIALGGLASIGAVQSTRVSSAIVFDAYGTLFDVHSVVALANELFPGQGDVLSQRLGVQPPGDP